MKLKVRCIILLFCSVFFLSFCIVILLYVGQNQLLKERKVDRIERVVVADVKPSSSILPSKFLNCSPSKEPVVEIWGKAAIGIYLWEHILEGRLETRLGGVWEYGELQYNQITVRFRTGPGVTQTKVPQNVQHLVLVLNGRADEKVAYAKKWLDYLPYLQQLCGVTVVLLGNEMCDNKWLDSYMIHNRGPVKAVYLVYDSPQVDNVIFFQWPLGVATYRGFPLVDPQTADVVRKRKYLCNFMGTMYKNSSRTDLVEALQSHPISQHCYVKYRTEWNPDETEKSVSDYMEVLQSSQLTLHPVGLNTECYRLYEAMSFGSVPVVEDVMTPGRCDHNVPTSPLRLLKKYQAPVRYIKNWTTDLLPLLNEVAKTSPVDLAKDRENVLLWYSRFKQRLKREFLSHLSGHILH